MHVKVYDLVFIEKILYKIRVLRYKTLIKLAAKKQQQKDTYVYYRAHTHF